MQFSRHCRREKPVFRRQYSAWLGAAGGLTRGGCGQSNRISASFESKAALSAYSGCRRSSASAHRRLPGQNLRVNVATGGTITDGDLNGGATFITGSAYTNNDTDPSTGTMLYGISSQSDILYSQNPPNAGTLTTIGALGVDTSAAVGFDISGVTGKAFASLTNGDTAKSSLYSIDLATGAATLSGAFGIGGNTAIAPPLLDITVAAVPEPATVAMMIAGLAVVGGIARRRQRRS